MTPCSACGGGDPRRFESHTSDPGGSALVVGRAVDREKPHVPTDRDFAAAGITEHGVRTLRDLAGRLGANELAPLHDAIDELRTYVGLLHTAAAGDRTAIEAFKRRALSTSLPAAPLLGKRMGREEPYGGPLGGDPRGGNPSGGNPLVGPLGGGPRGGGPLGGGPLGGGPLGGGPLGGGPLGGGPLVGGPLGGGPLGGGPLGGGPLGGDRPFPGDDVGPCGLGGPHPFTFFSAGLNASGVFDAMGGVAFNRNFGGGIDGPGGAGGGGVIDGFDAAFTWIDRGFAGWVSRATGVEGVLGAGRRWLDGGEPRDFHGAMRGLLSPGDLLPRRGLPSMCLDEYQVCISEFVFTAMPLAQTFYTAPFPPLGSLSPTDQCQSGAGPVSMFPPAGLQYPAQADIQAGTYVALDRAPANVISWTPQEIRLALPPGIKAGCHSVGWGHAFDPEAVNQIRGIGEQCRPFFGGNTLVSAPYAVWQEQGYFSIIDAPVIDAFHGPGGSPTPNAEACTPVTLTWATSVASCSGSAVQVNVTMLQDGQLYQTALPADGQLQVNDETNHTYTLRVQAKVGNQQCGLVTRDVTVSRFNELRVQAQGDTRCVDMGIGVSVDATISCPAPAGGLPVTITSSDTTRVANAAGTIDEGNNTTTVEVLTANQCGTATLTVVVPNHPSKQVSVTVASDPVIVSISPTSLQTCDTVHLIVNGSCLGERASDVSAWIDVNGQQLDGTVTMVSVGTQLRVDFPPLPAGVYPLAIKHCSRISYGTTPLVITTPPPSIASLTSPNGSVEICTTPAVKINWSIRNVTRVVLTRGATQIADRTYATPCNSTTDSVTDNLPLVTAGVSYLLTAFNADGAMTTKTLAIAPSSALPVGSAFVLSNSSGSTRNIFIFDSGGAGSFAGAMANGNSATIAIPQCAARAIVSIDPAAVATHNADFGDTLSATDVAVAQTAGPWTKTTTAFVRGLNGTSPQSVSV